MIRRAQHRAVALAAAFGSLLAGATPASAQLLNEVQVFGSEWVEIYNDTAAPLDLGDIRIVGATAADIFDPPDGILLPPGAYTRINLGTFDLLSDLGGETSVIDRTAGTAFDKVTYGNMGSAPLHTASTTLARAPDASAGTAPPDALTDGLGWTIAFTPSGGAGNSAPTATLGVDIRLNEFNAFPVGPDDQIELFNPTAAPIDVTGWFLVAGGMDPIPLAGVIDPNDALGIDLPGVQLESTEVLYLFDATETRLDQSGFSGAPPLDPDDCVGLADDGVAPILGFDFSTSGLVPLECSIGDPNNPPTPTEPATWGSIKSVFR